MVHLPMNPAVLYVVSNFYYYLIIAFLPLMDYVCNKICDGICFIFPYKHFSFSFKLVNFVRLKLKSPDSSAQHSG
jgi:hypothetical protein